MQQEEAGKGAATRKLVEDLYRAKTPEEFDNAIAKLEAAGHKVHHAFKRPEAPPDPPLTLTRVFVDHFTRMLRRVGGFTVAQFRQLTGDRPPK